ncbi:MAG: GNAT family N-acetyltransferase [Alphaproteobacteria bacterium]|nr:GNAT family N-acetyltransferase [Alphaproteobacteria bacterium]
MAVIIRRAQTSDISDLTRIETRTFDPEKYHLTSRANLRHLLNKGNAELWLAFKDKTPCGMTILLFRKNMSWGRLYSIAVLPEFQGGDIGKKLFEHAENTIKAKKLRGMILEIRADNTRHKERYLKRGYTLWGQTPNYYPDGAPCIKLKKTFP